MPVAVKQGISGAALAAALLYAQCAWAQPVAPDAGRLLRELQPLPDLTPPRSGPSLDVENKDQARPPVGDSGRVLVRRFRITGNTVFPGAELLTLLADFTGAERSLADLNAAAARITAHYREAGYPVARAYLPAQEIADGTVEIGVLEGTLSRRRIDNRSRLSDARAAAYFDTLPDGAVIRTAPIDRSLLLLRDTPGVGASRASLQPGASVGTSELLVELDPGAATSGNLTLDNYGNRYTGEYRLGSTLNLNSPFNAGDQLSFTGLTTDGNLSSGRLSYQVPVGGDGLRLGGAYFDGRYRVGRDLSVLAAHGSVISRSVYTTYPLLRSQRGRLTATVTLEQTALTDFIDATATVTDKRIKLASFGLLGTLQDDLNGRGVSGVSLTAAWGRLHILSADALATDQASAHTEGAFNWVTLRAMRLQRLSDAGTLALTLTGQYAGKNLNSSEKFALGGYDGVRAYPQGEALGDAGYTASLELRHALYAGLQGVVFYDVGSVTINRNPFGGAARNSRTLAGAGVGLRATFAKFQFKTFVAWRTAGGLPESIPAGAVHAPVWLAEAILSF